MIAHLVAFFVVAMTLAPAFLAWSWGRGCLG